MTTPENSGQILEIPMLTNEYRRAELMTVPEAREAGIDIPNPSPLWVQRLLAERRGQEVDETYPDYMATLREIKNSFSTDLYHVRVAKDINDIERSLGFSEAIASLRQQLDAKVTERIQKISGLIQKYDDVYIRIFNFDVAEAEKRSGQPVPNPGSRVAKLVDCIGFNQEDSVYIYEIEGKEGRRFQTVLYPGAEMLVSGNRTYFKRT